MQRVVWITSEFFPRIGGLETYVAELLNVLRTHCEIGLVTGPGQVLPQSLDGVKHLGAVRLATIKSRADFEIQARELRGVLSAFAPDAIHFASAGIACFASYISDIAPMYATVHFRDFARPWQQIPFADVKSTMVQGLMLCRRIFCVSQFTYRHVCTTLPESRCEVLHPGTAFVDSHDLLSDRVDVPAPEPLILSIGRLIPRKGHLELLRVLRLLDLPFKWVIVGSGPMRDLICNEIRESPLAESTELVGNLSQSELEIYWSNCDLFALTPIIEIDEEGMDAEGFGLVFLEAAARRKATVCSDRSGCVDAVVNGVTGIHIDPYSPHASGIAISELLKSSDRRRAMGQAGYARVKSEFRWDDRGAYLMTRYASPHD